jgi:rubrerythrin
MLSINPFEISQVKKEDRDKEILRLAIVAELDAVNLYEQMAGAVEDEHSKIILNEVAGEEKTHIGEFQSLLLRIDQEQERELANGDKEVEDILRDKQKG